MYGVNIDPLLNWYTFCTLFIHHGPRHTLVCKQCCLDSNTFTINKQELGQS